MPSSSAPRATRVFRIHCPGSTAWTALRKASAVLASLAVLLLSAGEAVAQRQAGPAFVSATLRLRETPSTDSKILAVIPTGAQVEVRACATDWCEARFRGLQGYVAERYLTDDPPAASVIHTGKGYFNTRGIWVPSPSRTTDGKPPAGASAQCRDGTYSFSMSRRGTCSRHGGVRVWLP